MNSPQERLYYLFRQYKNGIITRRERHELMEMIRRPSCREAVKELIAGEMTLLDQQELNMGHPLSGERAAEIFAGIIRSGTEKPVVPFRKTHTKTRRIWWLRGAAAAILIIVAAGGYFWMQSLSKNPLPASTAQSGKNDIPPGGNRAVLTLANGAKINLDSAHNGQLASQGNSKVLKIASGLLVYNQPAGIQGQSSAVQYNTLHTPRGGQYQVILPDGTKVWLNASSSIRFPTAFENKERQVEITGEAYFEVARSVNQPFIVNVNDMQIKVLGTHFNVNAYRDEPEIKTTLLEGSVKVMGSASPHSAKAVILQPGQQLRIKRDGNAELVNNADTDEAIAWKNGLFVFHNDDLSSVMRRLIRWYDVKVEYKENKIPEIHFTGEVKRKENISKVLEMLELAGSVRFEIEEEKIKVTSY